METNLSIQQLILENNLLKEKILILEKENNELNLAKEKLFEYSNNFNYKKYYQEHKEEILQYHKEYQKTEKYKDYQKDYQKNYKKNNPIDPELKARYNKISYQRRKEKKEKEEELNKNIQNNNFENKIENNS